MNNEEKEHLKEFMGELLDGFLHDWGYLDIEHAEVSNEYNTLLCLIDSQPTRPSICCLCGEQTSVRVVGNNNANGKAICKCGRHITIHFRRERKALNMGVFERRK